MKARIISIVLFVLLGGATLFVVLTSQGKLEQEYNNYIKTARENAKNGIPYVAIQNYKKAFDIRNNDEKLYQEYLLQTKEFDNSLYIDTLEEYKTLFSNSGYAYETLAKHYYEIEAYKDVLEIYNLAKENNVSSEKIEEFYQKSIYQYNIFKTGYQDAINFSADLALVKKNNKWGYLLSSGKYLIDTSYEEAQLFVGSTTPVKFNEEWFVINNKGIVVAKPSEKVDYLGFANENMAVVRKNNQFGYANSDYVIPKELKWDYATNIRNGVAAVKLGKKWALINNKQELITEYKYDDILINDYGVCISNDVIFAKENEKYIMLDNQGKQIGKLSFDSADMFAGTNPAAVKMNGKWGFVFADGTIAVEPKYEKQVKSYNLNLAPFFDGSKWGFMNGKGEIVIEPEFDECNPFTDNGISLVKQGEYYSYIKLIVYS